MLYVLPRSCVKKCNSFEGFMWRFGRKLHYNGLFMYSNEGRIRAVELYIKLGKCARPQICQLGSRPRKPSGAGAGVTSNESICCLAMKPRRKYTPAQKRCCRAPPHICSLRYSNDDGIGRPSRGTVTAWVCEANRGSDQHWSVGRPRFA
jgi:hypothetical protein